MKRNSESVVPPMRNGQRGQSLALMAVLLAGLLAIAALVVDLGVIYVAYQELVSATNAAALAGGAAIPAGNAITVAQQYSAVAANAGLNRHNNLKNVSSSINLACVSPSAYPNLGLPPCAVYGSQASANMIQVTESVNVPTFFARIFGIKNVPLSVSATASAKGGGIPPYHIMVILDATGSMGQGTDTGCLANNPGAGYTPEVCAQFGVQSLLEQLDPCAVTLAVCVPGANLGTDNNPVDQVGLMVFPGICSLTTTGLNNTNPTCNSAANLLPAGSPLTNTTANPTYAPDEYTCPVPNNEPAQAYYNNNPEYLVLGFQENYRNSDTAGLNNSSNIFKSIGAGTNSCGISTPLYLNTFYAGAIQAAQDYLTLYNTPGVQNIIILLSDGDANATAMSGTMGGHVAQVDGPSAGSTYPTTNECQQAVDAATYAKTYTGVGQAPTLIYSISYGSQPTGCSTDTAGSSTRTPCATMQGISSLPLSQYFFSVPMTAGGTVCSGAVGVSYLDQVFSTIAGDLTVSRLIPNSDF